jgi:pyruvate dehydrogenase E2 component (dihydrolipoamide acetyltransferase)
MKAPPARIAHASPSVRRLAAELGVDLSRLEGTGRKARILKEDIQQFVKRALAEVPSQPGLNGIAVAAAPVIDFSKYGEIEVQPLHKIRRVSARNLHRSWITVPHVTQFDEADITNLEEFRRSKVMEAREGAPKLTMLVFLMKSLTVALQDFPQFNSSLDASGDALILKKYFHVGIAVDTENGLVVPVIRDVDKKGLAELSRELGEVSQKARDRKLGPQDMSGGSITISSLGGIGGTAFTPIVNAPEVAILGVSRSQIKPVYRDGEFVPRLMLPLSLSYDHRVIDGADAARFTSRLKAVLSDIRDLLL